MTENDDAEWGNEFQLRHLPPSDRVFPWESADPDERNAQRTLDYERERERIEQRDHQYQQQRERERAEQRERVVQRYFGDKRVYRKREQQATPRVLLNEPAHEAAPAQLTSQPNDRASFDAAWNSWTDARIKAWVMPRLELFAECIGQEVSNDIKKLRLEVVALRHELLVTRGLLDGKISEKAFLDYEKAAA